jgi:thiamine-phosphate diphosphorylase
VDAEPTPTVFPILHAVTNDEIVGRASFLDRARTVMRTARERGALQLRAPRMAQRDSSKFVELARTLAEEQARTGAWLVVNDRVDVALIVCARGVQLAARSLDVADAVRVLLERAAECGADPNAAVGASLHSLEEGIAARLAGATWGVVGDVLAPHASRADEVDSSRSANDGGPALLERLVRFSGLPIVAIGGIVPQHVAPLRRLGVRGVAAIRGIWDADDSERAVTDYLSAYDSEVGR